MTAAYRLGIDPRQYAANLAALAGTQSFLPAQSAAALASSGLSPVQAVQAGESVRQAVVQGDDGFHQFWDDPVLHAKASPTDTLLGFIQNTVGPPPFSERQIADVQRGYLKAGYAKGLQVSGVWTPEWNAVYQQAAHDHFVHFYQGKKPGGFSFGSFINGLSHLNPSKAWNDIIGFAKAVPGDVRDLLADTAGGLTMFGGLVGGLPTLIGKGYHAYSTQIGNWQVAAGYGIEHALGADISPSQYRAAIGGRAGLGRFVQDVSTLLLLYGGASAGFKVAAAAGFGEEAAASTAEAAAREGIASATTDQALWTPRPGATGQTVAKIAGTRAFQNIPVLGRIAPTLEKLADADGLYYKARAAMSPYVFKSEALQPLAQITRPLGVAGSQSMLLGAAARGSANLSALIGGAPTPTQQSILGEHVLDPVNTALGNMRVSLFGLSISPSLDNLAFVLHGPFAGPQSTSSTVGGAVHAAANAVDHVFGNHGYYAQMQRATGKSIGELADTFGGQEHLQRFLSVKVQQYAVHRLASYEFDKARLDGPVVGKVESDSLHAIKKIEHEINNDPDRLAAALESYAADPHALTADMRQEMANSRVKDWRWGRDNSQVVGDYLHDGARLMDAQDVLRDHFLPFLDRRYLINAPDTPQQLGLARDDTLLSAAAKTRLRVLRDQMGKAGAPADWGRQVEDMLFDEFGVQGWRMPQRDRQMLDAADRFAGHLAAGVYVAPDAPQRLADGLAKLTDLGYKPVVGTDLGFLHSPVSPLVNLGRPLNWVGKVADRLGLGAQVVPNVDIAIIRQAGMINKIQDLVDAGKITLPPLTDARGIFELLRDQEIIDHKPGPIQGALLGLFHSPTRKMIAEAGGDEIAARDELTRALQIRDIPREKVVDALTSPDVMTKYFPGIQQRLTSDAAHLDGGPAALAVHERGFLSRRDAEQVYRAVVAGAAAPPGYMLGLSRLDDLFRKSMGFAGNGIAFRMGAGALTGGIVGAGASQNLEGTLAGAALGAATGGLGGERAGWALANLPNRLIQLRNDMRFTYNPYFSWRRIAKANVKMNLEGVPATLDPLGAMQKGLTPFSMPEAKQILARSFPDVMAPVSDDADYYLRAADMFGHYLARHYEAYAAGYLKKAGLSDDEIRQKIIRIFDYGAGSTIGRSALERSANILFFPFSFDKTLYRNLGGFLLDHPGQRILMTRALHAYDVFNREHPNTPGATTWIKNHLPLMTEFVHLNAFNRGLSLGEPGGVNRPLLNLFLPQDWSSSKNNLDKLKQFVPMIQDFSRVFKETMEQGSIAETAGNNMYQDLRGIPSTWANPRQAAEIPSAQRNDAFALERSWVEKWAPVLQTNARIRSAADKLMFPLSPEWGSWAGSPITKTAIREIIHQRYPAYSATKAVDVAVTHNADWQMYLNDLRFRNPDLFGLATQFATDTHSVAKALDSGTYDAESLAAYSQQLRDAAITLAERDSRFYRLYQHTFGSVLGPLEKVVT